MYTDDYENRGYPIKRVLLKLLIIILVILLLIWLVPKFIKWIDNSKKKKNTVDTVEIFKSNAETIKNGAINYFKEESLLPKSEEESKKLTVNEMISMGLIGTIKDSNNKKINGDKSYAELSQSDNAYTLKVNIKDSTQEDYVLYNLNHYEYCYNSFLCEKDEAKENEIASKQKENDSDEDKDIPGTSYTSQDTSEPKKCTYIKTIPAKFSEWSAWTKTEEITCGEKSVACQDTDSNCTKETNINTVKTAKGKKDKKYTTYANIQVKTNESNENSCTNYNYIKIGNNIYATESNKNYSNFEAITKNTKKSIDSWEYLGRQKFNKSPEISNDKYYVFIGADFTNCADTCTDIYFMYDVYKYNGTLTKVSSTTVTPNGTCTNIAAKKLIEYNFKNTAYNSTRKEETYTERCYKSTRTRKKLSGNYTTTRISVCNDQSLLIDGWNYKD